MKIEHILKSQEFADILKTGTRVNGRELALYVKQARGGGKISVGIILPKRYISKAVRRNYLKRVIYAYFREKSKSLRQDIKVVIRAKEAIGEKRKKVLSVWTRETLDKLLEKAQIVK